MQLFCVPVQGWEIHDLSTQNRGIMGVCTHICVHMRDIRQALAFLTNCVDYGIYAYNNDIYMYANPYIREFISSIL